MFVAELKEKDSSLTVDDSLIIKIINTRNTNPRRFMQPQIPLELALFRVVLASEAKTNPNKPCTPNLCANGMTLNNQ